MAKIAEQTQYTEQQIDDFCGMLEAGSEVIPGATAVIALQIIRQLQGEVQSRMAADDRDRRLYDE